MTDVFQLRKTNPNRLLYEAHRTFRNSRVSTNRSDGTSPFTALRSERARDTEGSRRYCGRKHIAPWIDRSSLTWKNWSAWSWRHFINEEFITWKRSDLLYTSIQGPFRFSCNAIPVYYPCIKPHIYVCQPIHIIHTHPSKLSKCDACANARTDIPHLLAPLAKPHHNCA